MITKYSIQQNDTQHTAIWHSLAALLEIRPVWRIDTFTASWDTANRYLTHVKTGALYVGLVAGGITGTSRGQWFHATCQSVGIQSYENLNESEISWHCVVYGSRNYSSVAFDLNVPLLSNRCHQEAHSPKTLTIPSSHSIPLLQLEPADKPNKHTTVFCFCFCF